MDGTEMRTIRKGLKLKQREFAAMIGRSMPQVCRYEKGHKPIPEELAVVVRGLA